jgi:cation diffusion facilitator family transporter
MSATVPLLGALVTAAISLFLARWESCAAHHLGSPVLHTSAEHNRADALSSSLTVVGVGGAMVGLRFLDPLVAVLETLDIMRLSGTLLGSTLRGLMDTALPPDELRAVEQAVTRVDGVQRLLKVRSRQAGPQTWLDLQVELSPSLSLEEAEHVSTAIRRVVQQRLGRPAETQVSFRAASVMRVTPAPAGMEPHA